MTAAKRLHEHLPSDYRRRATHSDYWLAYEAAFPGRTHRFCGKGKGETNHAERFFGAIRARLGRLVRRAYSFSKSVARHIYYARVFQNGIEPAPASTAARVWRWASSRSPRNREIHPL